MRKRSSRRVLSFLGPGLITGVADDDPAGIITDIQAGAQFRYALAWTAVLQFPLLAAVQLTAARIGRVTGHDLAQVLRDHYSPWVLRIACVLLVVANLFTAGADLAGVGAAIELITGIPLRWSAGVLALLLPVLLVFLSYRPITAVMKLLTLVIFAYIVSAVLARPNWIEVLRQTVMPDIAHTRDYLKMVVAVFGGTISPYMLFWQSAQEGEERAGTPRDGESVRAGLRRILRGTTFGMGISQIIEYFIFIAAGTIIFSSGVRDIETARQAAMALRPIGGGAGEVLFAIGIIGTGLIAIPTLTASAAYGVVAAIGRPAGINRPPREVVSFNVVLCAGILIAGAIALLGARAMKLLVASQVLNGLLAPPLLVLVLFIANNRRIVGRHTNGWVTNLLGGIATILMLGGAVALVVSWFVK